MGEVLSEACIIVCHEVKWNEESKKQVLVGVIIS